jgi:hypothetical protein
MWKMFLLLILFWALSFFILTVLNQSKKHKPYQTEKNAYETIRSREVYSWLKHTQLHNERYTGYKIRIWITHLALIVIYYRWYVCDFEPLLL